MSFTRRLFLASTAAVAIIPSPAALAWRQGAQGGPSLTARTLLNAYPDAVGNGRSYLFLNFLKFCTGFTSSQTNYPAILDANNYPNNGAVTSDLVVSNLFLAPAYGTSTWGMKWTGTAGAVKLNSNDGNTIVVQGTPTDMTVTGSGTGTIVCTQTGPNPRVLFNFPSGTPLLPILSFPSGKTYTNMAALSLFRSDQESLLDQGQIFNPDLLAFERDLNPKVLRTMDLCAVNATASNAGFNARHDYRAPTTALMYGLARWEPQAWVGDIANSGDAYSVAAPPGWAGLVDGATAIGRIVNGATTAIAISAAANNGSGLIQLTVANTTGLTTGMRVGNTRSGGGAGIASGVWTITVVTPGANGKVDLQNSTYTSGSFTGTLGICTLNVGSTGDIPISGINGGSSGVPANFIGTFIYNAVRNVWLLGGTSNGIQCGVPIEIQVALANQLKVHLYPCFNLQYTDASVLAHTTYVAANLDSRLTNYCELGNEIWNVGFYQFQWATYAGLALGFNPNDGPQYCYQALRHRQVMGIVTSAYAAAGKTNFKRVLAFQEFGDLSNNGTIQKFLMNGNDLTGSGNATYASVIGVNYNASLQSGGNGRPVDFTDGLAFAPYWAGGQCNSGGGNNGATDRGYSSASAITTGGPSGWTTGLIGAADALPANGGSDLAGALAFMDWDCIQGTQSGVVQQLTIGSPSVSGSNYTQMASCEARALSYDANRAAQGQANLEVYWYEGGDQRAAPSTQQCTDMGISTAYAAKINTLLLAHKNSTNYQTLVTTFYGYGTSAAFAHSKLPAWFNQMGNNVWSLMPTSLYGGPTYLGPLFSGQQFKSYDATKAFNS